MSTTIETIIELGFAKSSAARPESFEVTDELIARVGQCLREVFQTLSRENPYVLGTRASVAFDGAGWPRPADCLRVIFVQANGGTIATPPIASGAEIAVVAYDDQGFLSGQPSLTELGQAFVGTGQTMDPTNGSITIVYARAPIIPAAAEDTLDPLIPSFFDDVFQTDIAAYLAYKEKRTEDEQLFLGIKNALIGQLVDWATQQTYSVQARFPLVSPPLTNTTAGRSQPAKGAGA